MPDTMKGAKDLYFRFYLTKKNKKISEITDEQKIKN